MNKQCKNKQFEGLSADKKAEENYSPALDALPLLIRKIRRFQESPGSLHHSFQSYVFRNP